MILQVHAVEDSFDSLGRQICNMMDEINRRNYYRFSKTIVWEPPVNIYEDAARYYICAELAGLTKEQIEVEVVATKLTIRGERPVPPPIQAGESGCILRMEINSGRFERTIELPAEADTNNIDARLEQGFLWITIARQE